MHVAKKQARQGDILFVRIDALPKKLRKAKDNTIALGEITGHSHKIVEAAGVDVLENEAGDKFIAVEKVADVVHQEHGPVKLGAGDWAAIRQREYTPEAPVRVRD